MKHFYGEILRSFHVDGETQIILIVLLKYTGSMLFTLFFVGTCK